MVFIYSKENNIAAMDTKKERKALGKRIRVIRELKALSQEELGERASLSYKYLGELERGNVNVGFDSLLKISHALEMPVGDLSVNTLKTPGVSPGMKACQPKAGNL